MAVHLDFLPLVFTRTACSRFESPVSVFSVWICRLLAFIQGHVINEPYDFQPAQPDIFFLHLYPETHSLSGFTASAYVHPDLK